ncbi:KTSC domain-containing protein, partial [Dysosmobacter welbionis]
RGTDRLPGHERQHGRKRGVHRRGGICGGNQGRKPCWRAHADRPLPGRPGPDHSPGLP